MTATYDVAGRGAAEHADFAGRILTSAAVLWFLTAAAGQWLFVHYIVGFYGGPTLSGDFEQWDRNDLLTHGYEAGDAAGNLAFAAHVLIAAVITLGGTLQLVPQIRAHAIWLHRWNGRLFVLLAVAASLGGFYLNWHRGVFEIFDAITINGVLILVFAGLAFGFARAGDIDAHRRWALRLFMVVNGVWFLRVGMGAWMVAAGVLGGPPTLDETFFAVWSFGSYLLPLVMLELYLRARRWTGAPARVAVAAAIAGLTALMAAGVFGMYAFSWGPLVAA